MHAQAVCVGGCMGGVCGGHAWGACMADGVCVAGGACVAGEIATAAGGRHPTAMHSC